MRANKLQGQRASDSRWHRLSIVRETYRGRERIESIQLSEATTDNYDKGYVEIVGTSGKTSKIGISPAFEYYKIQP